ncbi:hypothetical protein LCGC14_2073810, partial [marine sediment metagenome]
MAVNELLKYRAPKQRRNVKKPVGRPAAGYALSRLQGAGGPSGPRGVRGVPGKAPRKASANLLERMRKAGSLRR